MLEARRGGWARGGEGGSVGNGMGALGVVGVVMGRGGEGRRGESAHSAGESAILRCFQIFGWLCSVGVFETAL